MRTKADGIVVLTGRRSASATRSNCWPPGTASAC